MLTYSFENMGTCSMYEHLYRCIRDDIVSGTLSPGEKLPSKRILAKNLSVSMVTVESAYSLLTAEGYIYSLPKRGYYVEQLDASHLIPPKPQPEPLIDLPDHEEFFADFVTNHLPSENFPVSTWAKLLREVLSDQWERLTQVSDFQGRKELQIAITRHLYNFRGMSVDPEQIVIGSGTEYLYGLLVQFFGKDKVFGVEDPGYQKPARIYESIGASSRPIPLDTMGIRSDCLEESGVDILHISPSHHFPTGIVMPISRRYELLGWCSRCDGRYIIEDDYDCEFRTLGKPIPTLQSIDASDRVIYINTFSKTLASTIRISYMVLPKSLVAPFRKKLGFYSSTVSAFEQLALTKFIEAGYFEKHINRMRNHYKSQKNQILQQLKSSCISDIISISGENEGLHFLLEIHKDIQDADLIQTSRNQGLRISCLSEYYYHKPTDRHMIVLNYSGLSLSKTNEAISRLIDCIRSVTTN